MTVFFTSDEHYFHRNIISYTDRPFKDVEEMNQEIIERHNSVVSDGDIVYHLGDFAFKETVIVDLLKQLKGEHHLCPGNHDKCHSCHHKFRKSIRKYLEYGFKSVQESMTMRLANREVLICHLPYPNKEDPDQRFQQFRPEDKGMVLLHGHCHRAWTTNGRMINVGVDVHNFYPISKESIEELIRSP